VNPNKKLILLTGASGFLGGYVADACRAAGHAVLGVDVRPPRAGQSWEDLRIQSCESIGWESFLRGREIDVVFHLAGGASVPESVQDPYRDFATSLPGTANLLSYIARRNPSTHFIFFSSAAVYGNPRSLPIGETSPVAPISPYGIHKASAEFLLQHYARLYNLQVSVLRLFSAFGVGLRKQLFWDLSRRALEASARGETCVTLHGSGAETRDFIYATDIANAALLVANRPRRAGFECYNIASGKETTIREAASLLLDRLGLGLNIVFAGAPRSGDPLHWRADISKAAALGFQPAAPLAEGLNAVARWAISLAGAEPPVSQER
jgi:UDP-glucose 4-epimerase